MDYFFQLLIGGVTLGSIYGLIAIGYTMVYGIIGMINFAHGEVFMLGSFVALTVVLGLALLGITFFPVVLIIMIAAAMLFTALWGWSIERIAYRPLRGSFRLAPLITAIGTSIFLQNFVQVTQGANNKPLPPQFSGNIVLYRGEVLDGIAPVTVQISYTQILIILTTVILMTAFTFVITRTSLGRQQRACEQDAKMASLLGVNVDRTISLTFVMGAGLAAVAGTLFLVYYGVIDFYIGFLAGVKAFTAAVLGGIGSLPGAMLGGLAIGLIETFFVGYFNAEYKDVAAFSILAIVLIFMPSGLLGRPEVEKV